MTARLGGVVKKVPWWVWVAGVLVIVLAVGTGVLLGRGPLSERDDGKPDVAEEPTRTPDATETPEPRPSEPLEPTELTTLRVYLVRGEHLGAASRAVAKTESPARAAMEQLLLGPTAAEGGANLLTEIPTGTRLLGLTVDGGTARVDLSKEFASGGGSLSANVRLAQVIYTLTQFPSVQRVVLLVEGEVVEAFMGEGLILAGPQTRADFESAAPAILVEGPTPGATVASPIRVWGTANTFEAAFMIRVLDTTGATVVETPAMATSGSGTRGTFDVSVVYPAAAKPAGTVVVFEYSAKDGSEINTVAIPVTMQR